MKREQQSRRLKPHRDANKITIMHILGLDPPLSDPSFECQIENRNICLYGRSPKSVR
jgi:hypothetical protein